MAQYNSSTPQYLNDQQRSILSTALSAPVAYRRRTKVEQACSRCRNLRRKCDGLRPCASCREQSLNCEYDGRRTGPEKLTLAKALRKIAQLEEKLHQATVDGNASEQSRSPPVPNLAFGPQINSAEAAVDDRMVALLRGVNHLTMDTGTPEFYGPSSANAIINAVEAMDDPDSDQPADSPDDISNRARLWLESARSLTFAKIAKSSLPPKGIADEYVGHYFRTAHRIYPILNWAHFMRRYDNFWNDQPTEGNGYELWIAVLCMVLALGHQCSTVDPDPRVSGKALQSSDGEMCFSLTKALLANVAFTGGDMSVVNSILLAFIWLYNQQRLHEAYTVLGSSTRIAYAIGLHREWNSSEGYAAESNGWTASWWCLFAYETELAAVSGRPCAIQPREADAKRFSLETSPVDLQYIECMRQFSSLAWEAYEQVYSLDLQYTNVAERASSIKSSDQGLCTWYETWYRDCQWSKEPHGLIIRLRCLNMRVLLHRGFLRLVTLDKERGLSDAIAPASKCVQIVCELIETITCSMNTGGSGTLQAALFSALGYLWNATITLLLYLLSQKAVEHLPKDLLEQRRGIELLECSIRFFTQYQAVVPFAEAAATKSQRFRDKIAARMAHEPTENPDSQHADVQDLHFQGSNELLETFLMLDAPLTGIADMPEQDFGLMPEYEAIYSQFNNVWPERGR